MSIPSGFKIEKSATEKVIRYRSQGMSCFVCFVGTVSLSMAVLFTLGLSFDVPQNFFGGGSEVVSSSPWIRYVMILLYAGCAFGVFQALWKIFGITELKLSEKYLRVRKLLFFLSRSKTIESKNLVKVQQIKDGGEGDDSFPSWGLIAYTTQKHKLLSREPFEKSDWLGAEIAGYYNIPFEESSLRE
jgi:hypothetical protein